MKRIIILSLVIFSCFGFCQACSCIPLGPLSIKDFNQTEIIFIGKVKQVNAVKNQGAYSDVEILFEITEIFKGLPVSRQVKIYTSSSSASCGIYVKNNENWLIYAYNANGKLSTSMCTRSRSLPYAKKEELTLLRSFSNKPNNRIWMVNGVKRGEGQLKNDLPTGYWRYFFADGSIAEEVTYVNGKPEGKVFTYIDPEEQLKVYNATAAYARDSVFNKKAFQNKLSAIKHYKNGKEDGEVVYFDPITNRTSHLMNYRNGVAEGLSIDYFPNGLVMQVETYINGSSTGISRGYYVNGQLMYEGKSNGDGIGSFKTYDETGKFLGTVKSKPYYDSIERKLVFQ